MGAPRLSVDSWNRDSHFMEDLGVDSGGFGRLISQTRSKPSLQKIDLQMLFEHPTVRSLAADSRTRSFLLESNTCFLRAAEEHPHVVGACYLTTCT